MVHFNKQGNVYQLRPDRNSAPYVATPSNELSQKSLDEEFTNVTLWCKGNIKFRMNHVVLAHSSALLSKVFRQDTDFLDVQYDILCPDFEPIALQNVLSLIYLGKSFYQDDGAEAEEWLMLKMREIMETLQIAIKLNSINKVLAHEEQWNNFGMEANIIPSHDILHNHVCICCEKRFHFKEALDQHMVKHMAQVSILPMDVKPAGQPILGTSPTQAILEELMVPQVLPFGANQEVLESTQSEGQKMIKVERMDLLEGADLLVCPACGKSFGSHAALERHQLKHHGQRRRGRKPKNQDSEPTNQFISCPRCQKSLCNKNSVVIHFMKVHAKKAIEEASGTEKFSCAICGRKDKSQQSFLYHIAVTHDKFKENITKEEWDLINQMRSSKVLKNLKEKVDIGKQSPITEERRSSINLNEISKSSDVANSRSEDKIEKSRIQVVSKSANYETITCNQCNFQTNYSSSMERHVALKHCLDQIKAKFLADNHSPNCGFCDKERKSTKQYIIHLVQKHNILKQLIGGSEKNELAKRDGTSKPALDNTDEKASEEIVAKEISNAEKVIIKSDQDKIPNQIKCMTCKKAFPSRSELLQHMAHTHYTQELSMYYGQEPGECTQCGIVAMDNDKLRVHLALKHNMLDKYIQLSEEETNDNRGKPSVDWRRKKISLSKFLPKPK